jgi:hypothetical protein
MLRYRWTPRERFTRGGRDTSAGRDAPGPTRSMSSGETGRRSALRPWRQARGPRVDSDHLRAGAALANSGRFLSAASASAAMEFERRHFELEPPAVLCLGVQVCTRPSRRRRGFSAPHSNKRLHGGEDYELLLHRRPRLRAFPREFERPSCLTRNWVPRTMRKGQPWCVISRYRTASPRSATDHVVS